MADNAKVQFLFKKIQRPLLQSAIEALKARQTSGTAITYTMTANRLSTAVSKLPEFLSKNRNISAPTVDKYNPAILNADSILILITFPLGVVFPRKIVILSTTKGGLVLPKKNLIVQKRNLIV